MKNFASSAFRLRDASLEIRLVYSLFLVFVAAGLLTTWALQFQRIGFGYKRIVAYYLGGEISGQISFAKNFNVLLEETHFHTFIMGAIFLILSHLFIATSVRLSVKWSFILLTFFANFFRPRGRMAYPLSFSPLCLPPHGILVWVMVRISDDDLCTALRYVVRLDLNPKQRLGILSCGLSNLF